MLRITNLEGFRAQTKAFVEKTKLQAVRRIGVVMADAQQYAANISPVYSGDFASNWNVSAGSPDETFVATKDYYGPEHPQATNSRWGMGTFNLNGFALGQTVYLTNAAEHDEPYAWLIEKGAIKFRDVNAGRDAVGSKTARHILSRLGT